MTATMTLDEAQRQIEDFLTGHMVETLRAAEYDAPEPSNEPEYPELPAVCRAEVAIGHVRGFSSTSGASSRSMQCRWRHPSTPAASPPISSAGRSARAMPAG